MAEQILIKSRKLQIDEAAEIFKGSMRGNALKELGARRTIFEKPRADPAFGDLDSDPPDFKVMAIFGTAEGDWQKSSVSLFAWSRDGYTELLVVHATALLAMGLGSKKKLRQFTSALVADDPDIEIRTG